jgi:ribulose-phosphate 3-epimerase
MTGVRIAPSILSADFARLGDQIAEAERGGADWIHVDVMDGHFVPNITIGPLIVEAARRATDLPLDVHLMIESPDRYLEAFATAGAHTLTVHYEACTHLHRTLQAIRALGVSPGVAINPHTPASLLQEVLPLTDLVVVMSVNPGFGGQAFIPGAVDKIRQVREMLDRLGSDAEIEVDGGVTPDTAPDVVAAGATVLVAGSAVYGGELSVEENLARLRQAAQPSRAGTVV